jgi:MOSC domain-containing protein YiiM
MQRKKEQRAFYIRQEDSDRIERCGKHFGFVLEGGKVNASATVKLALEQLDETREAQETAARIFSEGKANEEHVREMFMSAMVLSGGDRVRARALLRVTADEWIATLERNPGLAAKLARRWPN